MKPRTFYANYLESVSDEQLDYLIAEVVAEGKGDGLAVLLREKRVRMPSDPEAICSTNYRAHYEGSKAGSLEWSAA